MDESDRDIAPLDAGRGTDDNRLLAKAAFVLSAVSAIAYFASSRGIHNFVRFLIDGVGKALRYLGTGA